MRKKISVSSSAFYTVTEYAGQTCLQHGEHTSKTCLLWRAEWKRTVGKPHLHFKDILKLHLKLFHIPPKTWTAAVMDRASWPALLHTGQDIDTEKHLTKNKTMVPSVHIPSDVGLSQRLSVRHVSLLGMLCYAMVL